MVMKTKRKQAPIFSMLKELETGQAFSPAVKGPPETEQIEPSFSERKQTSKTYRVEQRTAPESSEDGKYALVDPEKAIQPGRDIAACLEEDQGLSFIFVEPGTFLMGSPEHEPGRNSDEKKYMVAITKGFYLQTTPVTQGQWKAVMGSNPSGFNEGAANCPVECVSWYDCQQFIKRLNRNERDTYRLPTEAEWEYACRAGTCGSCAGGEILELFCGHDHNLNAMGWYCGNSDRSTHPVAVKNPNDWGLFDMHGNVMEWCGDWYGLYPDKATQDPSGHVAGTARVIRGGSWFANAKSCRSAARFYWPPDSKTDFIGFRLVKNLI
jgi:formylglycine-generating enzyme required for sulfatase activity